jgi:hypothetical protein
MANPILLKKTSSGVAEPDSYVLLHLAARITANDASPSDA